MSFLRVLGNGVNTSSHIYLISPTYKGKHDMKSYYDMTQPPSSSYGSGANKLTNHNIPQGYRTLKCQRTTLGDQTLSKGSFVTTLIPQWHAWQGLGVVIVLQPHAQHCLHEVIAKRLKFRGYGPKIWATFLGQPPDHYPKIPITSHNDKWHNEKYFHTKLKQELI